MVALYSFATLDNLAPWDAVAWAVLTGSNAWTVVRTGIYVGSAH